jgi:hypothetical protein
VVAKVLFAENEINEKLLEEDDLPKTVNLNEEENRDSESVRLVFKRHFSFLKKLFNRYSSGKVGKKDYFDEESDNIAQIDLVRLCKEKNLEKNKPTLL